MTGIEPARGGFTIHCLDPLGYIRPYPRTGLVDALASTIDTNCLAKLQRLGCSLHSFYLTLLKIKVKIGGRREVKAHLVDSERVAST
ncbi:hypothetical protein RDABS01_003898 [Bienertia sinuspersici]